MPVVERAPAQKSGGFGVAARLAGLLALGTLVVSAVMLVEIVEERSESARATLVRALRVTRGDSAGVAADRLDSRLRGAARATRGRAQPAEVSGILIGADNRLSTSKLSAFAWTWVLAWAILSLAIADWVHAGAGWSAFLKQGLQDEYLVLLGGPFVALVAAKALVGGAVSSGSLVKSTATPDETKPADRITQAFSDDAGQTDLVDTQYLLFGTIALLVFIVMFLRGSTTGLPTLPELLIGLSSVGATAYIANKWTAEDAKPKLDRIVPSSGKVGDTVTLYGTNLLSVSIGGKQIPASEDLQVIYGGLGVQELSPSAPGDQPQRVGQRLHQDAPGTESRAGGACGR